MDLSELLDWAGEPVRGEAMVVGCRRSAGYVVAAVVGG